MVAKVTTDDIVDKVSSGAEGANLINDSKRAINQLIDAKEEALGNPLQDGRVLSSTKEGVRSWIESAASGEANVQADWGVTDNTSDSFIANKPTIIDYSGKEDGLGNPTTDGQILSSTIAGARSWIDAPSGGGTVLNPSFNFFQDALADVVGTGTGISLGLEGRVGFGGATAERIYVKPKWLVPNTTYFEFGPEIDSNPLLSTTELLLAPVTNDGINFSTGIRITIAAGTVAVQYVQTGTTSRDRTFSNTPLTFDTLAVGDFVRVYLDTPTGGGVPQVTITTNGTDGGTITAGGSNVIGWDTTIQVNRPIASVCSTLFNFGIEPFQGTPPSGTPLLANLPVINNNEIIVWKGSVVGLIGVDLMDYSAGSISASGLQWTNKGNFAATSGFITSKGWASVDVNTSEATGLAGVVSSPSAGGIQTTTFQGTTIGLKVLNIFDAGTNSIVNPVINTVSYKPWLT